MGVATKTFGRNNVALWKSAETSFISLQGGGDLSDKSKSLSSFIASITGTFNPFKTLSNIFSYVFHKKSFLRTVLRLFLNKKTNQDF